MAHDPLPYGRQSIDEDDIEAVVEVLRGDWLTQGPKVRAFERALCEATGAEHAIAVANGTAALHLAALASDIGPGDVGITSAITFLASANCIRYCGADVEFVDVDPDTGLMDLRALGETLERLESEGRAPKLVIPVDMCGQPCDAASIHQRVARFGTTVVVDAAHSLGATYQHRGTTVRVGGGGVADMTTFSFHPIKHVTTGEGGAIVTDDANLATRLRELRCHGMHRDETRLTRDPANDPFAGRWYYEQDRLGFNYRITDMQCALGLSQLEKLDAFVARRRELAARYDAALEERLYGLIEPLHQHPDRTNAYHLYVVRLLPRRGETPRDVAARRKDLYTFLRNQKILVQVNYIPVPWQPMHGRVDPEAFPGALTYYAGCLSLPMFPAMADEDVDRVVDALHEWVERGAGG